MEILIVQNGWSGQGISGGDKHLLDVAPFWHKESSLSFLLPLIGEVFIKDHFAKNIEGVKIVLSPELIHFSNLKSTLSIILAYIQRTVGGSLKILSLKKFNVVVSSSHFFYDVLPAVVAKICKRTKTAVYIYHLISYQGRDFSLRNLLSLLWERIDLFLMANLFDLVLVDNSIEKDRLIKIGFKTEKIFLTSNAVFYPENIDQQTKKFDLCFVGRLVKRKGIYDLVNIVDFLKPSFPGITLAVVGIGDEMGNVKKLVSAKNLSENIHLLGFLEERQKYGILRSSRVFVSPSFEEGWGISLAEAMAWGLPAVVYDLQVYRQVFGSGPIEAPCGDWKSMTEIIVKLLTNPDYYQEKSLQSRQSVRTYRLDSVASAELGAIKRLCG